MFGGVDPNGVERLEVVDRGFDTGFELLDGRLVVLVTRRFDADETRGPILRLVRRKLHLPNEGEHVRGQARL